MRTLGILGAAALAAFILFAPKKNSTKAAHARIQREFKGTTVTNVLVTGYCNCGKCCSWRRTWFGFGSPVHTAGALKGKPKKVGMTARGTKARHGTIAADPAVFPFGTRIKVPGYGVGVVEDVGGAIKGRHIDVWFPSHKRALEWGRKNLDVVVGR